MELGWEGTLRTRMCVARMGGDGHGTRALGAHVCLQSEFTRLFLASRPSSLTSERKCPTNGTLCTWSPSQWGYPYIVIGIIGRGLKCSPFAYSLGVREQLFRDPGLNLGLLPLISDTFVQCLDKSGGAQHHK